MAFRSEVMEMAVTERSYCPLSAAIHIIDFSADS